MAKIQSSVWETLSRIDCSEHVEKKGRFNYLSWTWAWGILKENYPTASFEYIKTEDGNTAFKDEQGYAFVRVAVTVEDETHTEDLAVMDNYNKDIKNPKPTQINNSLQRCLGKAAAFHGLGINVYAGEDTIMFDEVSVAIDRQKNEAKVAKETLATMTKKTEAKYPLPITKAQRIKFIEDFLNDCTEGDLKLERLLKWAGELDNLSEISEEKAKKWMKQNMNLDVMHE